MPDSGTDLKVEVVPWGPAPHAVRAAAEQLLQHPVVREELGDAERRVLAVAPDSDDSGLVRATIYDYTNERAVLVDAAVDGGQPVAVRSSSRQPPPNSDEFQAALDSLSKDPDLGPGIREGRLEPYRPMPPLVLDEQPDGTVRRTVAVGLKSPKEPAAHEIVAVHPARGEVTRFDGGAPPGSRATGTLCGLPNANQATANQGDAGQAKVTVSQGGQVLWTLIAVRPAASSGTNGSGIELLRVAYRGKRVLRRAHVPILNVRYDGDACGPFRDWQWEESKIDAQGTDPAPGFRVCSAPAKTILDSGSDHGNFLGVAVYVDGDEVVLVSEMEAGWYRYVSQWRLDADGTIRPRFGFGAVEDSCVCNLHHHHVYWRLNFDVATGAHNDVGEFNDPPLSPGASKWHSLPHEVRRLNRPSHKRRWRVKNRVTDEAYTLVPGPSDGKADGFGIGDMWALRARPHQFDDGQGFTTDPAEARAHINRFINGESIVDTDVVLWYAAHFAHDVHAAGDGSHVVGPELVPSGW